MSPVSNHLCLALAGKRAAAVMRICIPGSPSRNGSRVEKRNYMKPSKKLCCEEADSHAVISTDMATSRPRGGGGGSSRAAHVARRNGTISSVRGSGTASFGTLPNRGPRIPCHELRSQIYSNISLSSTSKPRTIKLHSACSRL